MNRRRSMLLLVAALALTFVGVTAVAAKADTATCQIGATTSTATAVDCPSDSVLVTYQYRHGATLAGGFDASLPQTLFDQGTTTAKLPSCGVWQADVVTPGEIHKTITSDTSTQYGPAGRLLAHLEGQQSECEAASSTTTSTSSTTTTQPSTTTTQPSTSSSVAPSSTTPPVTLARTGKNTSTFTGLSGALLFIGGAMVGLVALAERKRTHA